MKVWDYTKGQLLAEEQNISKGLMATCAIDPVEGKFSACGGMDGKIHVYYFNENNKKLKDNTIKLI